MSDIVGLDLGMPRDDNLNPVPRNPEAVIQDALVAAGRLGQKSGGGFFDYDDSRKASPSAEVAEIIAQVAAHNGTTQQDIAVGCVSTLAPQAVGRSLLPMRRSDRLLKQSYHRILSWSLTHLEMPLSRARVGGVVLTASPVPDDQ